MAHADIGGRATTGAAQAGGRTRLACALDLGWRVAELFALARDPLPDQPLSLLPSHQGLPPAKRLELQVWALVGDARGIGVELAVDSLVDMARSAPESQELRDEFRARVGELHVELQMRLWREREAEGKAYELGLVLSDTYNLIARAQDSGEKGLALAATFADDRVQLIDRLLGDLGNRLSAPAVFVVSRHLRAWESLVKTASAVLGRPGVAEAAEQALRDQTVVWRQLLTSDQEPEAYLDERSRAGIRNRVVRLAMRTYVVRPLPLAAFFVVVAAGAVALAFPGVLTTLSSYERVEKLLTFIGVVVGGLGLSRAAVAAALRGRARRWSELLFARAVVEAVCEATLRTATVKAALPAANRLGARVRRPRASGA